MNRIKIILSLIALITFTQLYAFNVVIAGKAPKNYNIKLHCGALIEDVRLDQNDKGEFLYTIDLKYPAQFQIEYGNIRGASYDFFVFEEGKIQIDIINEEKSGIKFKGLSPRSTAFASIDSILFKKYSPKLRRSNALDSLLNAVVDDIRAIPNIGSDQYTDVMAKLGRMVLMTTMVTSDLTPMFNVYDSPYFSEIPRQDARFAGFDLYNNLIWPGWLQTIKRKISYANGSKDYKPGFKEILDQIEMHKASVLPKSYVNAKYTTLVSADKSKMTASEKALWEKSVNEFCNAYPEYQFTVYLRQTFEEYSNTMVNNFAPAFTLKDIANVPVDLSEYKGKYILLDVWGSWCAPCRVYNRELVRLYEEYKSKGLVFLSVAYDKIEEDWKKAVTEDQMLWRQLYYSQSFLDDYKVIAYPTTFLISPDQIILRRSSRISKEDIDEFVK